MIYNDHSRLVGQHALIGASKYHWINYDQEKFAETCTNVFAKEKGTELHDIACKLIRNGIRLPKTNQTLNMYVNDAIGYRMEPEMVVYYSDLAFGTADALKYHDKKKLLRIHDLKTGHTPASMHQLEIYAAFFCLEYKKKPRDISIELRIYQSNEVGVYIPEPDDIEQIMNKIILFEPIARRIKEEYI